MVKRRTPWPLLWIAVATAEVSYIHPSSGSVAGGTFVELWGSGFRCPAGPKPLGAVASKGFSI